MKTIRNIPGKLLLLLLVLSISCAVFAQKDFPKIKAENIYKQSGITVKSPNQPDWQLVKAGKLETVFVKTKTDSKYNAFVKTLTIEVYENVKDLLDIFPK